MTVRSEGSPMPRSHSRVFDASSEAEIIDARPAMGIDDAQRSFLFLEIVQTEEQDDVLQNIREIPRMIDMPIVQGIAAFPAVKISAVQQFIGYYPR